MATGSRPLRNALLAACYLGLGALGLGLLAYAADGLLGLLAGVLLLLLAVSGLLLIVFDSAYPRRRPGAKTGTAPSGAPATVFTRSPVVVVLSTLVPAALAGWAVLGCVLAAGRGQTTASVVLGLVAVGLATPLVAVVRGRVAAGGLYLTPAGVEHRKESVSWSVPWDDVTGVVPGEPLALLVRAQPRLRTSTRVLWQREPTGPRGTVAVDSRYLAADSRVIAAVVARCVAEPAHRRRLGTQESLAEIAALGASGPSRS